MAHNTANKKDLDGDFAKELEEALSIDLTEDDLGGDLDIAASMEDLEAQISKAAEELAREGRQVEAEAPAEPETLPSFTAAKEVLETVAEEPITEPEPAELELS